MIYVPPAYVPPCIGIDLSTLPDIDIREFLHRDRYTPHPTRKIFRAHRLSGARIAHALGIPEKYQRVQEVLMGRNACPPDLDVAFRHFARTLEPGFDPDADA